MLDDNRWLLPEGIEEILPEEAWRLEHLRRDLLDLYRTWGYELVQTPFIEYLDSLLTGTGKDMDLSTFKLTDQLSGRLLGLRADMTPQVARIDSHQLNRKAPNRLCYLGTVLRTRPDDFGGTRSPLQIGAELYGHGGVESDVEILALMLATLRQTGHQQVVVDLGHVGIFRALVAAAGLDAARERQLFDALQRKAHPEITELLGSGDQAAQRLHALVDLNGGAEVLAQAHGLLANAGDAVSEALHTLRVVAEQLQARVPGVQLHFDLAELRGYTYHTGLVFAAYVPQHGEAVAQGGRYDDIGKVFGRARPATGFSADLKLLESLGNAAAPATAGAIGAPWDDDAGLAAKVAELRAAGQQVIQALPGQQGDAGDTGCTRRLVQRDGAWAVENL